MYTFPGSMVLVINGETCLYVQLYMHVVLGSEICHPPMVRLTFDTIEQRIFTVHVHDHMFIADRQRMSLHIQGELQEVLLNRDESEGRLSPLAMQEILQTLAEGHII